MFSFFKKMGCEEKYKDVSIEEAVETYHTAKNDYIWLDVRTETEYKTGHIPGAKLIPIDQLEERAHEVGPKDKNYMVVCHSGGRSVAACKILYEKGYRFLFNLPGGMSQWSGPKE